MGFAQACSFAGRRLAPVGLLAVMPFCVAGIARAHGFCVSSAAELQAALAGASDAGMYYAEDNDINVVAGAYETGAATANGPFFYHSTGEHHLYLSGGFDAGCHTRSLDASLTVLDGKHDTPVLMLRGTSANIAVSWLTLRNGESDEPGAGLQINYLVPVGGRVSVGGVIVRDNHSSVDAGGIYVAGGESLYFSASLVVGNRSDGQYGAGFLAGFGDYNEIFHNTVTRNTSAAPSEPIGGLYCGGTAPCTISNNIVWNNTGAGLYLGAAGAALGDNDYGTLAGTAPASAVHNLSVKPQFADPDHGDFHLAGNSPLLGFGTPLGTVIDVEGHRYPTTGGSDLGAYAETIFIDGYDSP